MLILYRPRLEDLWFREALLCDPATMAYNAAWGGTIPFPRERWSDWYDRWVSPGDGGRFYRYLLDGDSGEFVGETAYHLDPGRNIYLADIIIAAKRRGRGYGRGGLELLCQAAKNNGCTALYDGIAADNSAVSLFLHSGFTVEAVTEDVVTVKKLL